MVQFPPNEQSWQEKREEKFLVQLIITSMFIRNGYPRKFVKSVIKRTLRTTPRKEDHERDICLKLPFINEELKRRALAVIRRSGINGIRVHFMNGQPSSRVFAPPREKQNCPVNCETCTSALKENRCSTKHSVYRTACSHCHTVLEKPDEQLDHELKNTFGWKHKQFTFI